MKQRILILFAHPALQKSRVNCFLTQGIEDIEGVTFRDLYEEYPDWDIDVSIEQKLLVEHDVIIFHYPFYWYSMPALLREWQDLVLEHHWAYGSGERALEGKKFLCVITASGSEETYQDKGYNRFTIRQFLAPVEQTACLCRMDYLAPFVVHGSLHLTDEKLLGYREDYRQLLRYLREDEVSYDLAREASLINDVLDHISEKAMQEGIL